MRRNWISELYARGSGSAVEPHIYRQLVSALFTPSLAVFMAAALCIGAVGALTTYRTGDIATALLSAAAVVVSLLRAAMIVRFRRLECGPEAKEAAIWEARWATSSLGYAAIVGLMAARGVASTDDAIVHLLAAVSAVGTAGIVAIAAVRPNIVIGQLALVFAPLIFAVGLKDNPYYWALAIIGVPFVLMISELTYSLYGTAVRAFELAASRERLANELAAQNARFDVALSNMAQGLCMFDADLRLTVCNTRFLELFHLSPDVVRPGVSLENLIKHILEREGRTEANAQNLYAFWADQAMRAEPLLTQRTLADGRTLAINHRPMAGGGHVATIEDVTEQRRAIEKVNHLARHDVLTGLPNRLFLRERMQEEVMSVWDGGSLAVVCLDLDEFKAVNDSKGHPAGDALLLQVAGRLREALGEKPFLARLGGDEFAALVKVTDRSAAFEIGRSIANALSRPFGITGSRVVVGASVGIALAPLHGSDADTLLKRADMALYQAKAEGRRGTKLFETRMAEALLERRTLETELQEAVHTDQFELHYQPLIDLNAATLTGLEALIRWRHPRLGIVGPDRFIGMAEATGLIVPIGDWVLRQACRDAAQWPETMNVAVNLSPAQFRADGLVTSVLSALADSGLAADRLNLEVTESVLLHDSDANIETLRRLREIGVRVALDDFGTGYSSLSYLQRFQFDKVKIDKCFVEGDSEAEGLAIIAAVTGLCRNLGIATTVEGIETERQLTCVRAQGCTEGQGYYFGRPEPLLRLKERFPELCAPCEMVEAA